MHSSDPIADEYQLGPFKIKGKENAVVSDEGETLVSPKVMTMLLYLCRHSQQVATFDELVTAIWPREVVGDNAIYNLVGQLRKALGDNASKPIYIQTISKVGYRLLVKAEPIATDPITAPAQAIHTPINTKWAFGLFSAIGFIIFAFAVTLLNKQPEPTEASQSQLTLVYYQLNRGDERGVDQAIEALQQLIVSEPQWQIPQIELAYAFLRKAKLTPDNRDFWTSKANNLSAKLDQTQAGKRLQLILNSLDVESFDLTTLEASFAEDSILTSARLAFSDLLFERGKTQQAAMQAKRALDTCVDCPYVYRKFAAIQMVLGEVDNAFDSFSRYRMLLSRSSKNPADIAGYVPLDMQSLSEMSGWLESSQPPENLLAHQRNSLALFYLSLGQIQLAESVLETNAQSSTQFFDLYTHAAIAGAKGNFELSYELLQKRQTLYPENDHFKLSVVYAHWQLDEYEQALEVFNEHQILSVSDPLPDSMPFSTWSVYAALLLKSGDADLGKRILDKLEMQLSAGLLPGSQHADIRLAEVLALQGKNQQALLALETALSQGWVSDFNQVWWYLEDSPYFTNLSENPNFQRKVADYHEKIATLSAVD